MNPTRLLAWAIRLVGIVEIFAFAAVVMPSSWMEARYAGLGVGAMPQNPVFDSLMRQVSFTYGLHGVGMLFIAADVRRYRPLVWLTAIGYFITAPVFVAIDRTNGLPWWWAAGNGGSCLLVGVVLFALIAWERAKRFAEPSRP